MNIDTDLHFGQSQITDGMNYSLQRTLKKGCPKMMKLVQHAQDELSVKELRKPVHQFVASPRKMNLSHNKYAALGGHNLQSSKKGQSNTITNISASTAPTSGLFKSNGFEFTNRVSIQTKIDETNRLPSVMEKTVKIKDTR